MPKKPLNNLEKKAIEVGIASGKTVNAVAAEIGRDGKTVRKYAKEAEINIKELQKELSHEFASLAKRILLSVTDEDIAKASLHQKAVSSGIFLDKHRLLEGQAISSESLFFSIVSEACKPPEPGPVPIPVTAKKLEDGE